MKNTTPSPPPPSTLLPPPPPLIKATETANPKTTNTGGNTDNRFRIKLRTNAEGTNLVAQINSLNKDTKNDENKNDENEHKDDENEHKVVDPIVESDKKINSTLQSRPLEIINLKVFTEFLTRKDKSSLSALSSHLNSSLKKLSPEKEKLDKTVNFIELLITNINVDPLKEVNLFFEEKINAIVDNDYSEDVKRSLINGTNKDKEELLKKLKEIPDNGYSDIKTILYKKTFREFVLKKYQRNIDEAKADDYKRESAILNRLHSDLSDGGSIAATLSLKRTEATNFHNQITNLELRIQAINNQLNTFNKDGTKDEDKENDNLKNTNLLQDLEKEKRNNLELNQKLRETEMSGAIVLNATKRVEEEKKNNLKLTEELNEAKKTNLAILKELEEKKDVKQPAPAPAQHPDIGFLNYVSQQPKEVFLHLSKTILYTTLSCCSLVASLYLIGSIGTTIVCSAAIGKYVFNKMTESTKGGQVNNPPYV